MNWLCLIHFSPSQHQLTIRNMKIILIGYGKMGKAIEQIAKDKGHEVILKISSDNKKELKESTLRKADSVLEFTKPDSAYENLKICIDAGVPVISGTTGWTERLQEIKDYCQSKNGTMLWASNFSIGANIFFEINERLAELLAGKNYQVNIEETHHIHKLDKPSGTAISLAGKFIEAGLFKKWSFTREEGSILISCNRIDEVNGIHTVNCISAEDKISLTHEALSRTAFARGAVMAAEWIQGKKGCFTMKDLLKSC